MVDFMACFYNHLLKMFSIFIFKYYFFALDCGCAGKMPPGYIPEHYNSSLPFNPIATNGEPFPWHKPNLPNNVRPIRYTLTIHPNLTTLDVKGKLRSLQIKYPDVMPLTPPHKNSN